MSLIIGENLTLGYDGKAVASGVNFSVDAGDYLCIVGENGSGKSTLMKTILGLLPPVSGEIRFSDGLLPNEIGYLPQQTPAQKDFPASVQEVVLSGCLNRLGARPFYSQSQKETARKYMDLLHITDMAKRCYRELSGGQQQRVLLARALCASDKLLLLDEPVAGLDPKVTEEMYKIISDLNRESGIAVIMVTHDLYASLRDAGKVLHLAKTPLFFGTVSDYLRSPAGKHFAGSSAEGGAVL